MGQRQRSKGVAGVESAREPEVQVSPPAGDLDADARQRGFRSVVDEPDVGPIALAIRDDPRTRARGRGSEGLAMAVVGIDHRKARSAALGLALEPREQAALRVAVRLERLVEVEVLVREVREDRRVVVDAADAIRREAVAARLDDDRLLAGLHHLAQQSLQLEGARGRVRLGVAAELAADADADGPQETRPQPCALERRLGEERGRGLAVRAGDPDRQELAARVAVPPGRRGGEGRRSLPDDDLRDPQLAKGLLHDDRDGASLDGLADVVVAIDLDPADGDEQVAGLDGPRVISNPADGDGLCINLRRARLVDGCEGDDPILAAPALDELGQRPPADVRHPPRAPKEGPGSRRGGGAVRPGRAVDRARRRGTPWRPRARAGSPRRRCTRPRDPRTRP